MFYKWSECKNSSTLPTIPVSCFTYLWWRKRFQTNWTTKTRNGGRGNQGKQWGRWTCKRCGAMIRSSSTWLHRHTAFSFENETWTKFSSLNCSVWKRTTMGRFNLRNSIQYHDEKNHYNVISALTFSRIGSKLYLSGRNCYFLITISIHNVERCN